MKFIILAGLLASTAVMAEKSQKSTIQVSYQCRANATDGAYGFATHMNLYTAQNEAVQKCQAMSRRPETCAPAGCMQTAF